MEIDSIINFLLIAGVIQGFGFNLVTLFIKKKFTKVIVFLNLTILFISLNNLQRVLSDNEFFSFSFLLKEFLVPWYVLVFPMFYAFTARFLKVERMVNDFIKPTIIIFVLEIVLRLILISYVYYEIPNQDRALIQEYTQIEEICNLFYSLFVFGNACLLVFRKNKLLEYILAYDDLNWLKLFIKLGSVVIFFWVLAVVMLNVYDNEDYYGLLRLTSSIWLYWVGYQGFYKYNVVEDRIVLRQTIASDKVLISSPRNIDSADQDDDFFNEKHQNDFEKIKDLIIKNKLYLEPLLSMEDIADELRMSKSYISKLINSYSDYNFSDFVNSLRVEQAKKFLSNDEFSNYTIVAIGLECGFNSKSTFYSAFKKFTSETPTTFRAQY
jgi:AraC-like DNA-binding protein